MTDFERAKRFRSARTELNRHGNQTQAQVHASTGISASALSNLENPECSRISSSRIISVLAEYYGVNIAWLTGQSDSPSMDEEIQKISNTTGLSAESIRILRNLTRDGISRRLVNSFIQSEEFAKLIFTAQIIRDPGTGEAAEKEPVVNYVQAMKDAGNDPDMPVFSESDREDLAVWKAQRLTEQMIRKAIIKLKEEQLHTEALVFHRSVLPGTRPQPVRPNPETACPGQKRRSGQAPLHGLEGMDRPAP